MRLRGRLTLAAPLVPLGLWLALSRPASLPAAPPPVAAPPPAPAQPALPAAFLGRLPAPSALSGHGPDPVPGVRLSEQVPAPGKSGLPGPLRVDYTLDVALSRAVFEILRQGRVDLGHVVVLDPASGDVLAYAATDVERFPPTEPYPAASLIKVVTAAAALESDSGGTPTLCRTVGNRYRINRLRLDPPRDGRPVSLARALAVSDNQCFAQLAIHAVGSERLLGAIRRFGFLESPAPAHGPGVAEDPDGDRLALGRLGCGLAGCRITPLHAARLAAVLADGRQVQPRWIARVRDAAGREVALPPRPEPERVLEPEVADRLRAMLVQTTQRGTARRAFRTRRGPLLQSIRVAGKTGSLHARDPDGRYEWFIAVAPAERPRVALAVLVVHSETWWVMPAQIAAEVLKVIFCPKGVCRLQAVERWFDPAPQQPAAMGPPPATRRP